MLGKIRDAVANYFHTTDLAVWGLCAALSGVSLVLLAGLNKTGYATQRQWIVQAAAIGIGWVGAFIASKLDYQLIANLWKFYTPLCYGLVLLTFTSLGTTRGDDQAWLVVSGFSIQPGELLKIAFILVFGLHLSKVHEVLNEPKQMLLLVAHGMFPVLLIHFQGDDGTALMIACIFVSMIFAAGISWRYILVAVGAVVVSLPLLWFVILTPDQKARIQIFLNPELDPLDKGMQQLNGLLALGSGQMLGSGVFSGGHVYVPEIRNDFIFVFLGNATGFMGCLGVCALLLALCVRIMTNSLHARDNLGRFIYVGVFAMIAFQSIVNIGMCLSVLPVIGVTLPFLSSGGTSVVTVYAGIGLCLSVYMRSYTSMFSERKL